MMDIDAYTSPIPEEAIVKAAALTARLMDELRKASMIISVNPMKKSGWLAV